MSGHGFHVHGPHNHEVEHVTQHGGDSFTSRLAVLTAILSTIGALFGYMGGHSQNSALLFKNEAAIQKTSASDQWNYYQAKSNKQNLAELSLTLTSGEAQEKFRQSLATTLLQIAIALSAITLLTRKRWTLVGVHGATGLGMVAGLMGYLHV